MGYTYTWLGVTYTTSWNVADGFITNSSGCDSLVVLDLTINTKNNYSRNGMLHMVGATAQQVEFMIVYLQIVVAVIV